MSPAGESIFSTPGAQKYGFAGNWKLQVENGMDGYHPPVVHQSIVEALEKRLGRKLETYTGQSKAMTRDLGGGHVMLDYRQCQGNRSLNLTTTYNGPPSNSFRRNSSTRSVAATASIAGLKSCRPVARIWPDA